jgi:hypothetical protein
MEQRKSAGNPPVAVKHGATIRVPSSSCSLLVFIGVEGYVTEFSTNRGSPVA